MEKVKELPKGWVNCYLTDFCKINMGQSLDSCTYNNLGEGLPFYQGKTEFGQLYPKPVKYCNAPNKIGDEGDVLISVRAPVGPTNLLNHKACIGRGLAAIKPLGKIQSKFILFLFRSMEKELSSKGTGTTFKAITKEFLCDLKFKIPPLPEQHRIVAKIEELFSELDKGVESLKTAQQQLKVYRQAVLKCAFEGKLTVEWRKGKQITPVDELYLKLRKELSSKEKELGKKLIYVTSLAKEELVSLGELPDNWKWIKLGEVFEISIGATPSRKYSEYWNGIIPWVSSGEVKFSSIYYTKERITENGLQNSSAKIHPEGTVLIAMIGEGKTRGQASILKIKAAHNQNVASIRVSETEILPEYIYYFLYYNYQKTRQIGSGNNQKALNKERVCNLTFPLCNITEQAQIVQEIESRLSVCDKMEEAIEKSLAQAEALRQSILKKAFEGKLVPQDPNDEPAEKLLERIRLENQNSTPKPTKKKVKGAVK